MEGYHDLEETRTRRLAYFTKKKKTAFKLFLDDLIRCQQNFERTPEVLLGVFGIRDIRGKNYRDTGYLRKKLLGYRILRSSLRDMEYSQKIVTYQMFDEKRSWITKYMPFSLFLLMYRGLISMDCDNFPHDSLSFDCRFQMGHFKSAITIFTSQCETFDFIFTFP